MIPTRAQVITYAQFLSGDPTGSVFVDNASPSTGQINMGLAFESAYREIYTTYDMYQLPKSIITLWYNLPAFSTQATPSQMGATNFQTLASLEERNVATTATISSADTGTPITLTTSSLSAAGVSTDTEILVSGVNGQTAANGRWMASVQSDTTVQLINSVSLSAFTSSPNAILTTSNDFYTKVLERVELPVQVPQIQLLYYVWQNDTFYFVGSTTVRELRLAYFASGTAPTTGAVGIDDSLDFLAYRTAAISSKMYGNGRGPDLEAQATALLNMMITPLIRQQQNKATQPKAYRTGGNRTGSVLNPSGVLFS